jgi:LAS superfamily LD-carboxypeptidase LdcB
MMSVRRRSMRRRWNAESLTGRTRAHVIDCAALACTLHAEVVAPLLAMRAAAAAAGIDLKVVSAFRDFERQLAIWNNKFLGTRPVSDAAGREIDVRALDPEARVAAILLWSALPGASRHHWGTDVDVIDLRAQPPGYRALLESHEYAPGGVYAQLTAWLDDNMAQFGFFRPYYTPRRGVQPEAWHLSYAPLAEAALRKFSRRTLHAALSSVPLEGREIVLDQLDALYERYVCDIDTASSRARISPRLF